MLDGMFVCRVPRRFTTDDAPTNLNRLYPTFVSNETLGFASRR